MVTMIKQSGAILTLLNTIKPIISCFQTGVLLTLSKNNLDLLTMMPS